MARRRISAQWRPTFPTCRRIRRFVRWRAICLRSARARPTIAAPARCSAASVLPRCVVPGRNEVNLAHLVGSKARWRFPRDRDQAVAGARQARGRRLPFRQLSRAMAAARHRQAGADRCGTGRRDHDRARPRDRHVPADIGSVRARRASGAAAGRIRRRAGRECTAPQETARAVRRSRLQLEPWRRLLGRRRCSTISGRDHGAPHRRPQHHDVDEGGRQADLLRRGLRGAARASRHTARLAVFEERHPAPVRPPRSAACTCGRS